MPEHPYKTVPYTSVYGETQPVHTSLDLLLRTHLPVIPSPSAMSSQLNRYWIPNFDINKRVITKEIQYYLGPESTLRPYTRDGEDGYLISTPGECLTDEQIDDICIKSKELWEKQAAARAKKESDKQLKRPLHQPIVISRGSKPRSSRSQRPDHKSS